MKAPVLFFTRLIPIALGALVGATLGGCGGTTAGNPAVEDFSVSGEAASAAGGALSGSSSSGTLARQITDSGKRPASLLAVRLHALLNPWPQALASTSCPTFRSDGAAGCTSSGDTQWLALDECRYGGAASATWNGTLATIVNPGLSAACGSFPSVSPPGNLYRQYVTAPGSATPGSVTITSAYGTTVTVDNGESNGTLENFARDPIPALINNGYGAAIHFNSSGIRDQVTLAHWEKDGGKLDLTFTGQLGIARTPGGTDGSRTITGSIRVYHNYLRILATSTFESVIHEDSCCFPVGGVISTTFSEDPSYPPTSEGSLAVGKTEILTLTGCGTGTLQKYDGTVAQVVLTRCF